MAQKRHDDAEPPRRISRRFARIKGPDSPASGYTGTIQIKIHGMRAVSCNQSGHSVKPQAAAGSLLVIGRIRKYRGLNERIKPDGMAEIRGVPSCSRSLFLACSTWRSGVYRYAW